MSEEIMQPMTRHTSDDQQKSKQTVAADDLRAVLIHNDDVTPYEYVIELLGSLFLISEEIADHIAWTAHTKGTAVVVVRPRPEAEKLVMAARGRAQREGFPLTFSLAEK